MPAAADGGGPEAGAGLPAVPAQPFLSPNAPPSPNAFLPFSTARTTYCQKRGPFYTSLSSPLACSCLHYSQSAADAHTHTCPLRCAVCGIAWGKVWENAVSEERLPRDSALK